MKRLALTSLAVGIALLFAVALLYNSGSDRNPRPAPETAAERPETETGGDSGEDAPDDASAAASDRAETPRPAGPRQSGDARQPAPDADLADVGELSAAHVGKPGEARLGSTDPEGGFRMRVELTRWGAGVLKARLARYHVTAKGREPYPIIDPIAGKNFRVYPFAARAIHVNGERIEVQSAKWGLVESDGRTSATYALRLEDEAGEPVLRVERAFRLAPDSYELVCRQRLINLADGPLAVSWEQYGQGDVPRDRASYLGDRRMLVAGYFDLAYDPDRGFIDTAGTYVGRGTVLEPLRNNPQMERVEWPGPAIPDKGRLAWIGTVNRYFAAVVHPALPDSGKVDDMPAFAELFPKQWVPRLGGGDSERVIFGLRTDTRRVEAGSETSVDVTLFAGPRLSELYAKEPYASLQFERLVVYELGCTWCTFQPLAHGLLAMLEAFHAVVLDWGLAIILLVLLVRLLLHPITRRSQANMMKMQKQMQAMQPEIERLKKKYANDQQKFQQEQMKLFREKGVNPLNMLGCLPMFLQMPIWIALYAMLYYAIELRHEPAFYGIFQLVSAGEWDFLRDLSRPDRFITFTSDPLRIPLPLVSALDFSSLNVLPILWAGTMFVQQKLMTPEASTEQQAQQQKMMQYVTLAFPLFLYSAPSGLTLYILASTGAGILDMHLIRKHVQRQEEAGTLYQQKPRKEGGLMDRFQKALEAKQEEMQRVQQQQPRGGGSGPGAKGPGSAGGGSKKRGRKR